jgi:hypothetical protein
MYSKLCEWLTAVLFRKVEFLISRILLPDARMAPPLRDFRALFSVKRHWSTMTRPPSL